MVRVVRAAGLPVALAGMIALCGVLLGRVYSGPLLMQLVAGAAVLSVGLGAAVRRLPSWTVAPLSVLLLAGYTVFALRLSAQRAGLGTPLAQVLVDAARNGIPRMLTAMIPVEPTPDTIVVPLVTAWLAGLAAHEVSGRAGYVLLGYLAPIGLFGGVLYVVGPNADAALPPTLGFVALAALGLATAPGRVPPRSRETTTATTSGDAEPAGRLRRLIGPVVALAVLLALTFAGAPRIAGIVTQTPVDPRRYVEPPQVDSLDESPLNRISGWALNPDQHLFDVTPLNGTDLPLVRLAVLNDYDGVTWKVGATYRAAGRVLPTTPPAPGSTVEQVDQRLTIADLSGRLLPAVPTPSGVDGTRVAFDAASGTLIRPEGLQPGLSYTVSSAREKMDLSGLPVADVPGGPDVARLLTVPDGTPEQVQQLADQLGEENGAPYDRAVAIEQFLATHYRVTADAASGHAYPNLGFFLFGPRNAGGQEGTSEQFAASFAVLARLLGLPSRVVVGFAPRADAGSPVPVRGADAFAWPEVLFGGVGWVSFNPMPQADAQPRPVEEDFRPEPEKSEEPPTDAPVPSLEPSATASAGDLLAGGGPGAGRTRALVAGGVSGTLLLTLSGLVIALLIMRRGLSRRRLRAIDPRERVTGAWLEVGDALRLAGRPASPDLTATEFAGHAAETASEASAQVKKPSLRAAAPSLDELAALMNQDSFAPRAVDDLQASRAGTTAAAYVTALRARRSWWRRALWSLHPGPLRWARKRR
ncbi:transglutaminase family protein [Catenuloplanes japonicus]|uniref:transglutaminase family protein n=1 Tax=Catenuloplanes japonicus TaxID=33876 RepID=UPI000526CE1B|nr:transglutaminase domain-containing protein [Catenuloplanes japonicus]